MPLSTFFSRFSFSSTTNHQQKLQQQQQQQQFQQQQQRALDAKELIGVILPSCQHRPSIHNEIVKIIHQLHLEMESHSEIPKHRNLIQFVPALPPSGIGELSKDCQLVRHLITLADQPRNRAKLTMLQQQLLADVETYKEIQREKTIKMVQQRDYDIQLLAFVVEHVADRPHVYNQVVVQLQQLHHRMLYQQRRQHHKQHRRGGGLGSGCASSTPIAPLTWKKEERPSAEERWKDVVKLDELIDMIPETSSIRTVLVDLQKKCRDEAKRMLKVQVKGLEKPPALVPVLSFSSVSTCEK